MSADPVYVPDEFGDGDDDGPVRRGAQNELVDPSDPDSDYKPGDWWERDGPKPSRPLVATRCDRIKSDGTRCRRWAMHGLHYCVTHSGSRNLPNVQEIHDQTIHNAKMALLTIVPAALTRIEQIIDDDTGTIPASVQLKASTEVLDRTGIRGGTEIDVRVEDVTDPGEILRARLEQLRSRAAAASAAMSADVVEGEVVEDGDDGEQLSLWEAPAHLSPDSDQRTQTAPTDDNPATDAP